jgi:hypothetical protein
MPKKILIPFTILTLGLNGFLLYLVMFPLPFTKPIIGDLFAYVAVICAALNVFALTYTKDV